MLQTEVGIAHPYRLRRRRRWKGDHEAFPAVATLRIKWRESCVTHLHNAYKTNHSLLLLRRQSQLSAILCNHAANVSKSLKGPVVKVNDA
jgi:hypothetical protein